MSELGAQSLHADLRREGAVRQDNGAIGQAIGPEVIRGLHEWLVQLAKEIRVVKGRKLRMDTTVVETNIHCPTESSLLGEGAHILTRTRKKID